MYKFFIYRSKKSSTLVSSSSNRLERSYTPPLPADGGTPPTTPPPLPPFSKPYSHPPGLTPPLPGNDLSFISPFFLNTL